MDALQTLWNQTRGVQQMSREELFPQNILLAAQHSQRATGVLACVTLAQWALESNYGRQMPAGSNNPFGIKARKGQAYVECKTKEWTPKRGFYTATCRFAKYDSIEQAFIEHGRLLTRPKGPYVDSIPFRDNLTVYLTKMGKVYATDPQYSLKLLKIINTYKLYELNIPVD